MIHLNSMIKGKGKLIQRGFSLVELMVVVVILSILVGFIANEVRQVIIEAKVKGLKNNLKVIRDAIKGYRSDKGIFPSSFKDLTDAHPPYLMEIPVDPFSGGANWLVRPQPYNLLSDPAVSVSSASSERCRGAMGQAFRLQDGEDPLGESMGATWYSTKNEVTISISWPTLGNLLIERVVIIFEDKPYLINSLTVGSTQIVSSSDPIYVNKYEYVMRTTSSSLNASSITLKVQRTLPQNKDVYPSSKAVDIEQDWVISRVRAAYQKNVLTDTALNLPPNFTERQFRNGALAWFKGAGKGSSGDGDLDPNSLPIGAPKPDGFPNYKRVSNTNSINGSTAAAIVANASNYGEYQFGTDFIDPYFKPDSIGVNLDMIPNRESVRIREIMVFKRPQAPGGPDIFRWMPEPMFASAMSSAGYQELGLSDVKSAVPEFYEF